MDYDLISIFIFYSILLIIFLVYRKRFTIQSKIFVMYKTKLGLKLMDKFAKLYPRLNNFLAYSGIFVGFGGMLFVFSFLIIETFKYIVTPGTPPPLTPILPSIEVPGLPPLSFWHWIISIFLVAVIHEFSHGLVARLYNVKIKSSGFAFLGPLLAAFVEPDEKNIKKIKTRKQLAIFAAGPFSNIIMAAIIFLCLIFIVNPIQSQVLDVNGIVVQELTPNYALIESGIEVPFILYQIDGMNIFEDTNFEDAVLSWQPGDKINLVTDQGEFTVEARQSLEDPSRAVIGMNNFRFNYEVDEKYNFLGNLPLIFPWISLLVLWIFLISLGVGLFNLLPLGPVDGGRMLYSLLLKLTHNELLTRKIWSAVSWFCLFLIIINLLPWLEKLINFLIGIIILVISLML